MKLCIISDTHNKYKQLVMPDADMIIHCGDATSVGYEYEIANFLKWFSKLDQYKYKIFIAGNHDWFFEKTPQFVKQILPDNVVYLEDSGVEIEGIKFYGTPVQLEFCNWAFNRTEEKLAQYWEAIPEDTDVLITHSPPLGMLDYSPMCGKAGSPSLLNEVTMRIKPKVHCFGHIHHSHGVLEQDGTTFVNASVLNDNYQLVFEPIVVEI
jgi:Icc-related predicted phosphoesterase